MSVESGKSFHPLPSVTCIYEKAKGQPQEMSNTSSSSSAFCAPAQFLSTFARSPRLHAARRRATTFMVLRRGVSKSYQNHHIDSEGGANKPAGHHSAPSEPQTDAIGGNHTPPLDGDSNGFGDSGGNADRNEGSGDDGSINPEILAILEDANRDFSSLPADVQSATVEQLKRLLAVEAIPLLGNLARVWPALRNRLMANNRLPIQLGVELTVGFVTKTLAELQGRGEKFWKEFDFYLSDIALELVGDAMLVWLLSPTTLFSSTVQSRGLGGKP